MSFIPDIGDKYYFASCVGVQPHTWESDSIDVRIARNTGLFPYTLDGRELANWQHAFLIEIGTPKFWGWVDDYVL